jgi:hypothetical protein
MPMILRTFLRTGMFVFVVLMPLAANAADVTLAWDSNAEVDLAGYQIGYGLQPGSYTSIIDTGNRTTYRFTDLQPNQTYFFSVRAYNMDGLTSAFSSEVSTKTAALQPVTLTNLVSSLPSSQPVGTSIMFFATPAGGVPPYQFKWFVSDAAGGSSSTVVNWTASNMFTWVPAYAAQYSIKVWTRDSTSTADAPQTTLAMGNMPFLVVPPAPVSTPSVPTALALTGVTANLSSPQPLGARIRLTAATSGGGAPLQFKWMMSTNGGVTWTVTQNWSMSNTFDWTPTVAKTTLIFAMARSAWNTTDYPDTGEAVKTISFDIR